MAYATQNGAARTQHPRGEMAQNITRTRQRLKATAETTTCRLSKALWAGNTRDPVGGRLNETS
jgi:hypothetical protein